MNAIDVANGYKRMLEMRGYKLSAPDSLTEGRIGNGLSELARDLGISHSKISRDLALLNEPKELKDLTVYLLGTTIGTTNMFIRTKVINGNPYLYAVYPYREGRLVKQKQQYLGKDRKILVSREEMGKLFTFSYCLMNDISSLVERPREYSRSVSYFKENLHAQLRAKDALKLSKALNHFIAQLLTDVFGYEEVLKDIPVRSIHYMLKAYVYETEILLPRDARGLIEGLKQKLEDML